MQAHLLRELTYIKETCSEQQQQRTDPLAKPLLEIKASGERARAARREEIGEEKRAKFFRRYDWVVARAAPPTPRGSPPGKGASRPKAPRTVRR